jgi:hypothetical protein
MRKAFPKPPGPRRDVGHGYSIQRAAGYWKIWHNGAVVDRALTSTKARQRVKYLLSQTINFELRTPDEQVSETQGRLVW